MSGSAWLLYFGVLAAIVVVDLLLGATAEYLNAYELLRQAFGLDWPRRGECFLIGQARLGRMAIGVGLLAWWLEGAVITWFLRWLFARA